MKYFTGRSAVCFVLLLLVALRLYDPSLTQIIRLKSFDYLITRQEPVESQEIVIVDIGERTLQQWGQWPPRRDVIAKLIQDLREMGAGVIALNVLFPEADRLGGDTALADALKNDPATIIAQTPTTQNRPPDAVRRGFAAIGEDPSNYVFSWRGAVAPIRELAENASGVGVVATVPEPDGVVRRMPLLVRINGELYPSFPLEIIRVLAEEQSYQIKTNEAGIEAVRIPNLPIMHTDSNGRIWLPQNATFRRVEAVDITPDLIKDRAVIVGLSAEGLATVIATPRGERLAQDVQAQTLQGIVEGNLPTRTADSDIIEQLTFLAFGAILIVVVPLTSVLLTIPLYVLAMASSVYGSFYLFDTTLQLWDFGWFALAGTLIFFQLVFNNFAREFFLKMQIKKQFGTYLSPALVEKLQKNPELLKLGGETRELSIMFTDVRGFTTISEHYGENVQGLTQIMNRYMTAMTAKILDNNGTLDKYIGDAQMAFWNAPIDNPKHAKDAVRTALAMLGDLKSFNEEIAKEGVPAFGMGLGINTGNVVVGNMGSDQRFDYTCLGDSVNLAARLEGQSKPYGVKLILGPLTARQVCDEFNVMELDLIAVKGKTEPVSIYTVVKEKDLNGIILHRDFLKMYRRSQWHGAKLLLKQLMNKFDGELNEYYKMMEERMEGKPPANFDGVYRATSK
jgi:adenylate cyclase